MPHYSYKTDIIILNKKTVCYSYTVVGDYINRMKTTFDFNFDLHQAVKQHGYINKEVKKSCQLKKLLFDCL